MTDKEGRTVEVRLKTGHVVSIKNVYGTLNVTPEMLAASEAKPGDFVSSATVLDAKFPDPQPDGSGFAQWLPERRKDI